MKKYIHAALIYSLLNTAAFSQSEASFESTTQTLLQFSRIQDKSLTPDEANIITTQAKKRLKLIRDQLSETNLYQKFLLPNAVAKTLPKSIKPYLENEVTDIEGQLEIRAALLFNQKGDATQYLLHQKDGKIYYLHFNGEPPNDLKTDAEIKITHGFIIPTTTDEQHLVLSAADVIVSKQVNALPLSFGPQSTITMLINFSDKPAERPWTSDQIKSVIFTDINNYYYEASYRQTTIVGQMAGWFVVNLPSTTSCDTLPDSLANLADAAATSSGINLSQFKHKVYVFPYTNVCGWAGLGSVGGAITRAWINGYGTSVQIISHELGHNVGLGHSSSLNCPTSPIDGNCTVSEYGDGADTMGNIVAGHFNAFQKDRLGWLNYQSSPPITTVTQSGSYFLDAYETVGSKPKALKVLKRAGGSDYYYLEYRQGIGFDQPLATCTGCDYTKGIIFHQGNPSVFNTSRLLDMSPGATSRSVALLPCQSWTDAGGPNGGITFLVQSISSQGARVKITYGGLPQTCHSSSPTIKFSPSNTIWLGSGEQKKLSLSIENNDSEKCEPRVFSLSVPNDEVPFSTRLNQASLRLAPGEKKELSISIHSNQVVKPYLYTLGLMVKDGKSSEASKIPLSLGLYPQGN